MNSLNGYTRAGSTWWRVILVAVVLAVSIAGCGTDSPAKRASSAPAVLAQTSKSTSISHVATQPPSPSRAKRLGLIVPPQSAVTVPDRWEGPGKSASQFLGGMFIKGCRAGTLVGLLPKIRGGQTPVEVTLRGISGRAHGFLVKQVVQIDNEGDPVLGGADLPRLRSGRYLFSVRFAGDAERLPTTLEYLQDVTAHC